jgi:hypothetical protein
VGTVVELMARTIMGAKRLQRYQHGWQTATGGYIQWPKLLWMAGPDGVRVVEEG